jgi:PmbA protein
MAKHHLINETANFTEQQLTAPVFVAEYWQNLSQKIIQQAKALGASDVAVAARISKGFIVSSRLGDIETVEHHQGKGLDISVYFGKRIGNVSITDTRDTAVVNAVKAACHIAKFTQDDIYSGLAEPELFAYSYPHLALLFPWNITIPEAITLACNCEQLALQEDSRIVNSEGAMVSSHENWHFYANSANFSGFYGATNHSINLVLVAQQQQEMQRDYSYTIAVDPALLSSPVVLAKEAVKRTVRRLGARRITTQKTPVLFSKEEARRLLKLLVAAISGGNLFRKSSFLLNSLGQQILPNTLSISENPHLAKGLGSSPFDEDGLLTRSNVFVADGILQNYALSIYAARKLAMTSTGNAGGVHNLSISAPVAISFNDVLQSMHSGLLVTEVLGSGTNLVTGDYSHGACGFWVENGAIQYPVEEITIAGNLRDMFANIVAIGNDIDTRGNILTGSLLIAEMTIAGA